MEVDNYVDWVKYWNDDILQQIKILEDFEPELVKCTREEVLNFIETAPYEVLTDDCYINTDGTCVFNVGYELPYEEYYASLHVRIGIDGLLESIELDS